MNNCRICFEDINNNENYLELTCKHVFHYECLKKMINTLCPLCKKDNKQLFICNEIYVEDNVSEDSSDDYINDDYSDSEYEYHMERERQRQERKENIDKILLDNSLTFPDEFICNINNLYIIFSLCKINRAYLLYNRLQEHNLKIRDDSELCKNYIDNNDGNIDDVVDMMIEMNWFCKYTNYNNYYRNIDTYDRIKKSFEAKNMVIEKYIKEPHKFQIEPPNTKTINLLMNKNRKLLDINNIIKKWNGNANKNIYEILKQNNYGSFIGQFKSKIDSYLNVFAKKYSEKNYEKYIINENYKNSLSVDIGNEIQTIYPQLNEKIICNLHKNFDKFINKTYKNFDFRYNKNYNENYNPYCREKILIIMNNYICEKYLNSKILKFLKYEKEKWHKHIRGTLNFRNAVVKIIEDNIEDYLYNYVYNNEIYKIDMNNDLLNKLNIAESNISMVRNCIQYVINSHTNMYIEKVYRKYCSEKNGINFNYISTFIKGEFDIDDYTIKTQLLMILLNEKNNIIECMDCIDFIENNFIDNKLKKLIKTNKYLCEKVTFAVAKCDHFPSPYCKNNCCKNCCDGCEYHTF